MRLSSMREILENTAIDHVYYRTYDPMPRCVGREYTPHRAAQIAMLVAGGRLKWTPDIVEAMYWPLNSRIELVWNIDNASAKTFSTDAGEWDRAARADVVDAGATPEWVKALAANVKATGNVYGVADDAKPVGKAKVLYIADDTTRAKTPEIAEAMKAILSAKKVDFSVLAKGTDGWGLYDLGLWDLAKAKAAEFAGFIKESGAKTVVANCPAVVYALREWYPSIGLKLDAEILHHTELSAQPGCDRHASGQGHLPRSILPEPLSAPGGSSAGLAGQGGRVGAGGMLLQRRESQPVRPALRFLQRRVRRDDRRPLRERAGPGSQDHRDRRSGLEAQSGPCGSRPGPPGPRYRRNPARLRDFLHSQLMS